MATKIDRWIKSVEQWSKFRETYPILKGLDIINHYECSKESLIDQPGFTDVSWEHE